MSCSVRFVVAEEVRCLVDSTRELQRWIEPRSDGRLLWEEEGEVVASCRLSISKGSKCWPAKVAARRDFSGRQIFERELEGDPSLRSVLAPRLRP
jgi:hypothetical protein